MYKDVKKYMSKTKHLFLDELYFGFFQTFEDSNWVFEGLQDWKKPKYNLQGNKCPIFGLYIYLSNCNVILLT